MTPAKHSTNARMDSQHTFKQIVTQGLKSIAQTIGSAIHLVRISPSLTFSLLATMPVLYGILNIYGTYLRKLSKQGKELDGIASGLAGEVGCIGLSDVRYIT